MQSFLFISYFLVIFRWFGCLYFPNRINSVQRSRMCMQRKFAPKTSLRFFNIWTYVPAEALKNEIHDEESNVSRPNQLQGPKYHPHTATDSFISSFELLVSGANHVPGAIHWWVLIPWTQLFRVRSVCHVDSSNCIGEHVISRAFIRSLKTCKNFWGKLMCLILFRRPKFTYANVGFDYNPSKHNLRNFPCFTKT